MSVGEYRCKSGFPPHTHTNTSTLTSKKKKEKNTAPDLIRFVLFITLISTSLLSPLQMRVRWGGSGFDDLKCTQLTSYSSPAQLLRQFNGFFSILLMLTCQGGKGGKRPRNCSIILAEMLSDSKNGHNFFPFTCGGKDLQLFIPQTWVSLGTNDHFCATLSCFWRWKRFVGKQGEKEEKKKPYCFKAVSAQNYGASTFPCTRYTGTPPLPICHHAVMIRRKKRTSAAVQISNREATAAWGVTTDAHDDTNANSFWKFTEFRFKICKSYDWVLFFLLVLESETRINFSS